MLFVSGLLLLLQLGDLLFVPAECLRVVLFLAIFIALATAFTRSAGGHDSSATAATYQRPLGIGRITHLLVQRIDRRQRPLEVIGHTVSPAGEVEQAAERVDQRTDGADGLLDGLNDQLVDPLSPLRDSLKHLRGGQPSGELHHRLRRLTELGDDLLQPLPDDAR